MTQLIPATSPEQVEHARKLFAEYEKSLGVSLCFQDFDDELRTLPGAYAPPLGALLLALHDGEIAGCCALRPMKGATHIHAAEMKRLYVRPAFRGLGIARLLVTQILREAIAKGYPYVVLDTLKSMTEAQLLYRSLGFEEITAYYENPMEGARYLKLDLATSGPR